MSNYNPDTPCAIGVQWQPHRELALPMRGEMEAYGFLLGSTADEQIDQIQLGLIGLVDPLQEAGVELEVYVAGSYPGTAPLEQTFRPTEDVTTQDVHGWTGAARDDVGPFYQYVDDAVLSPGTYQGRAIPDTTFLSPIFGAGMEYACRFGGIAGAFSSEMVCSLTLYTLVSELVAYKLVAGATFVPYLELNGTRFMADQQTVVGERPGGWLLKSQWTYNPETGCSWKVADLDAFDAATVGADGAFGWVVKATGSSNNVPAIFQAYLTVEYLASDPRVVCGCLSPSQTDPRYFGWNTVDLVQLDGSGTWAKVNGTEYLLVVRRRNGDGSAILRALVDNDMPLTDPEWTRLRVGLSPRTLTVLTVEESTDETFTAQVPSLILVDDGGGVSLDSQPYLSINDDGGPGAPFDNEWTRVHGAQTLTQEVTSPGAGTAYGYLRCLIAVEDVAPADDLTITLIGPGPTTVETITVEYADLVEPQTQFQVFETLFGPDTLAAVQYDVEFSSAGSASGEGWRVQVLSTLLQADPGGPDTDSDDATFGGGTDALTVGADRHVELDAVVSIHTVPDAPTDLAASVVDGGHPDGCWEFTRLDWTATALADCGLGLLRYEIERSTDGGTTWKRVAAITAEAVEQWDDYEAPRNTESRYRIRARREDQAFSEWSDEVTATPEMACCGFLLTTNEDPDRSLWFPDVGPRSWTFGREPAVQRYFGRNFGVAWGSLEEDGDQFTIQLLVGAESGDAGTQEAATPGRAAFADLLELCSQERDPATGAKVTPSYVAVVDEKGNVWLASVTVTDAEYDAVSGEAHTATVVVREATDTPSTPDVSP